MNKYWFKTKKFGYWVYPVTFEWFLVTFVLVLLILLSAYSNNFFQPELVTKYSGIRFLFDIVLLIIVFSLISIPKTEWEWKWRWGKRK